METLAFAKVHHAVDVCAVHFSKIDERNVVDTAKVGEGCCATQILVPDMISTRYLLHSPVPDNGLLVDMLSASSGVE
jgi:hypothetical protein